MIDTHTTGHGSTSAAAARSTTQASTSPPSTPAHAPPTAIRPTPLHPLQEDTLVLQDTRSSADTNPVAAHGTTADPADEHSILPKRAPDDEAQAARDKLERIAKAQQTRRNWAKSTGVTVVAKVFGRNDRRQRRRRHGISSDEESSDSSSTDDDQLKEGPGEVKLMITGNPVVTRVFDAASRARGRFRGQTESPEVSPQNEEAPFRFSTGRPGSSLARRFRPASATPPPEAALKGSLPSPSAEIAPRSSFDAIAGVPDRPKSRMRSTLNPELLVVDEEGHSQHASQDADHNASPDRPTLPFSRSFNSHTPISFVSSTSASGPNPPGRGSVSSFIGGPIHDEPDAHDHDAAQGEASPVSSSVSSVSTDDELDDSALVSDSDEGADSMLKINSLNLEHGATLTKEQLKHRKKLLRREIRRRKANGEPVDDLIQLQGKVGQLSHKVSKRVSKGIHYASSQSRNRRAMDRYSPHPMQLSLQTSDLPRSSSAQSAAAERGITPFSAITPSLSRGSNHFGQRRESVASSRRSSMTVDDDDLHDGDGGSTLRRFNTIDRSMLSSRNSIRKYLHTPNVIKRRRQRKWEAEMAALEQAAEADARKADPEAELDNMLAKYAQQQAPAEATKVKYEFDVLYENQRGLLVFGIPKFSPRTLFQWDPSPWTSSDGKRSAYNIANAQLPDPSWEWAYQEWFIDMTGDVDEAGWQYSGNFGRRFWPNVHFPHGRLGMPKTGADGIREMNARLADKEKKRQEKEDTKEDGGFEAIKRSARARSSKWTGTPDAWTFVRRRRWIRLRRRKPLAHANAKADETVPAYGKAAASPAHELPVPDSAGKAAMSPGKTGFRPGRSDDEHETESSLGGSEESDSTSSEDDEMLYAPAYGRPSGFLPRRLPGNMSNGRDPSKSKDPRVRRRARKHAREFTGTIRELKSLLPSIIAMDREAKVHRAPTGLTASQSSYKWAMLKINKVDARNPFISWHFVKHRLQDEDMAFAATTLRTMERKFQQRQLAAIHKRGETPPDSNGGASHPPIPSSFGGPCRSIRFDGVSPARDNGEASTSPPPADTGANTSLSRLQEPFAVSPVEGHELTREALVEINFARALRVLRACKIDRQRMDLWKLWLGVISLDTLMETARREDLAALGLLAPVTDFGDVGAGLPAASTSPPIDPPHLSGGSSFRYRQRAERVRSRWRASVPTPDASDVWDVLERKLDDVLLLFEFQSNRAQLIKLLLMVHEKLHPDHVYRDRSLRANPVELSPAHVHGDAAEMGGPSNAGGAFGSRLGGWKRAGLPRLEFFSDLQRILAALPGNEATTNSEYILSQPSPSEELDTVAMPLGHHTNSSGNALIDKLEAEALSDSFLDHEKIPSSSSAAARHSDGAEIKRPASTSGKRLSVVLPPDAERGWSRSPSPIPRAPSVPLPYRHSPLSSVMPTSQGSLSTQNRSSLSILERARPTHSAESSPPSTAPGKGDEAVHEAEASSNKGLPIDTPLKGGNVRSERDASPPSNAQHDGTKTATAPSPMSGETTDAGRQHARSPRPPIPTRSGSVSPLTTAKERF